MSKTRHKAHGQTAAQQVIAMLESQVVALQKQVEQLRQKVRELER
jgi:uncharacterized coiled-coil protein SlyX